MARFLAAVPRGGPRGEERGAGEEEEGEAAGKGEEGTAAASSLRRGQHRRFALFFPSAESTLRGLCYAGGSTTPQNLGALFVPLFLSALKAAATDTLMRDVDVDIDSPCSSSWQSFEVLLEVHCSRGGDDFFWQVFETIVLEIRMSRVLAKTSSKPWKQKVSLSPVTRSTFRFSRVLGVS